MAQKWSILDQKWPNMAGLSTLQSGSKGTKMVNLSVFGHLDPLGLSGPFWTISNKIWLFAPKHLRQTLLCPFGAKNHLISDGISLYITPIHMYVPYPQHCATLSQGWLQAESQGLLKQANCQSSMPQKKNGCCQNQVFGCTTFFGGRRKNWRRNR